MKPAASLDAWVDEAIKAHALTLQDVLAMAPGTSTELLLFDRNFGDSIYNLHLDGQSLPVAQALRPLVATFVKGAGALKGRMAWSYLEREFEFDVRVNLPGFHMWYPFTNGALVNLDPPGYGPGVAAKADGSPYAVADFPLDTRVGWRGPCVRWSDVERMDASVTFQS